MAKADNSKVELEQVTNDDVGIRAAMEYVRRGAEHLAVHPIVVGSGPRAVHINKLLLTSWVFGAQGMCNVLRDLCLEGGISVQDVAAAIHRLRAQGVVAVDIEGGGPEEILSILEEAYSSRIVPGNNTGTVRGKVTVRALSVPKAGKGKTAKPPVRCPWDNHGGQTMADCLTELAKGTPKTE